MKLEKLIKNIYSDLIIEILNQDLITVYKGYVWNIPDKFDKSTIRWIDVRADGKNLVVSIKYPIELHDKEEIMW